MMIVFTILFLSAIILGIPQDVFAWGPGVHIATGNNILTNLHLISPVVADILYNHKKAFLYGCLSADIFIGKGSKFKPRHSHNWVTGFSLLKSVSTKRLKAYAYGYLSHLAADIVAHNYYVPNSLLRKTPGPDNFRHFYIELQADRSVSWNRRQAVELFRTYNREADSSLLATMNQNYFSFLMKKQLFKSGLMICEKKSWDASLTFFDRTFPYAVNQRYMNTMIALAKDVVLDFLKNPSRSPALDLDPIGSRNLHIAKKMNPRRLRSKRKRIMRYNFKIPADLHNISPGNK